MYRVIILISILTLLSVSLAFTQEEPSAECPLCAKNTNCEKAKTADCPQECAKNTNCEKAKTADCPQEGIAPCPKTGKKGCAKTELATCSQEGCKNCPKAGKAGCPSVEKAQCAKMAENVGPKRH